MDVLAWVVFVIVQIAFIPLAIFGVIYLTVRMIFVSKRMGISATASSVIGNRWLMDLFGVRADPAALRLYSKLPNGSVVGMWLLAFPSWLRYRINGKPLGVANYDASGRESVAKVGIDRTRYFDNLIAESIGLVKQMVWLGAGLDTRPYGALRSSGVRFFELDQQRTQQMKIEALRKAQIDASEVVFVPVDFAQQSWWEALAAAGFDSSLPSLFLWEGVTLYLKEEDVRATLRGFRDGAASGSLLLCDIYDRSKLVATRGVTATNEGFDFGLDLSSDPVGVLRAFVQSEGLVLDQAFLMGNLTKSGTFGVVAEIRK